MKRFGIELLGLLLAAAGWGQLLFLLYGQKHAALSWVCGGALAFALVARLVGLDWGRITIGLLLGLLGGGLLLGGAAAGESLMGGCGAFGGGLLGYAAWRALVALVRQGHLWGVPPERGRRWATRFGEWGGLLLASGAGGLAILTATDLYGGEVKLQGYDAVGLPGEPVRIAAKLEKKGVLGLNPDLHDVELEFEAGGSFLGIARTESEGIASLKLPVKGKGIVRAKVTLHEQRGKWKEATNEFVILILDKDQEWCVSDIDHTICDTDDMWFPVQANDSIPPIHGAATALSEIAKKIQPIYITGRDDIFMSKTRDWLDGNGFPKGPVFYEEWGIGSDVEKFKAAKIAEISKLDPNVHVGFGDMPTDARAYLRNKLTPYILRSKPSDQYPDGITPVKDWEEILSLLRKSGRL